MSAFAGVKLNAGMTFQNSLWADLTPVMCSMSVSTSESYTSELLAEMW